MAGELELQVAEGLIGHLAQRHAHELSHGEPVRLALPAVEEQLADGRQMLRRALVAVVVGLAGP